MIAPTESDVPAAVTGGGHVVQTANPTATAAVVGTRTETRRERGREIGTGTESGHQKTKVIWSLDRHLPVVHQREMASCERVCSSRP